jgi:tetratricopeptide (TPR) repeat protein/predicted Ser/Thr protein kinase
MIGETISHYKILEKLGEGGMGVVYKAQDTKLERTVAIKFLPPHLSRDEEATKRFMHEAKAASALDHPNIATIHEVDRTADGRTFVVMAYYDGETLKSRIDRGCIPVNEALDVASQVAAGLACAHETAIVHRDIKPSNIIITKRGDAKIIDFGLAKLAGKTRITREGSTLGTAAYMSPEQAMGKEVDQCSDIFSLGSILYEMLAGEPPFTGEHEAALLYEIVHEPYRPLLEKRPDAPAPIEAVLARCLAKDRSDRYQSASELQEDISRIRDSERKHVSGADVKSSARGRQAAYQRWVWGIAAAAIVAVLVTLRTLIPPESGEEKIGLVGTAGRPAGIIVSELDGPADDPSLAAAVGALVVSSLNESRVVRPFSDADIKQGLKLSMKPDTARVTGEVARELAYRGGAPVYISGRVDRIAGGYSIVLNVMDSESGSYVFSVSGVAETKDDLIGTAIGVSGDLRRRIGEHVKTMKAEQRDLQAVTPSFEAYRAHVRALELHQRMRYAASIDAARGALRIDPDLAHAWALIGYNFSNMGREDSSLVAFEEALKRSDRLTERNRLSIEAMVKMCHEWDLMGALNLYDRLVNEYSYDRNNYAVCLQFLGRYEESLDMLQQEADSRPFGPNELLRWNMMESSMILGRYKQARELIRQFGVPTLLPYSELILASAQSEWPRADSIAQLGIFNPVRKSKYLAARDASRGSMRRLGRRYVEMRDETFQLDNYHTCFWLLMLERMTGSKNICGPCPMCEDETIVGLIIRAFKLANRGDIDSIPPVLEAIRANPARKLRKYFVPITLVELGAAQEKGDMKSLAALVESLTESFHYSDFAYELPVRWMIADAYEHLGYFDEAAERFEYVLDPKRLMGSRDYLVRPSYCAYAHRRLALLYARLGNAEKARDHLDAFEAMFTHPDPELEGMLDGARNAVHEVEERT